jgi:hypothetical protein
MNNQGFSKIGILVILIVLISGGILIWQYPKTSKQAELLEKKAIEQPVKTPEQPVKDETADWKIYKNEEFGYKINYPDNWRVAYSIMSLRNKDYPDRRLLLTNLSEEEEQVYLQALKSYTGIGSPYDHVKNGDGRSIEIYPSTITFEELGNSDKIPGWEIIGLQEKTIQSGYKILRFREKITWEADRDFDKVLIPYSGNKLMNGKKITYIVLSIERNNGDYEKKTFEGVLSSFRF